MKEISHKGIVHKRDKNYLEIEIIDGAQCSTCSHSGSCSVSDEKDLFIQVEDVNNEYHQGQEVEIHLPVQTAFRAVFWAYVFPFTIVLSSVVILSSYVGEGLSALLALSFLTIYYVVIFWSKKYFNKKFNFTVTHLNHE